MSGFGDLMKPGGEPGQEPEAGSWSDLVKDPIARSALLGFGLQMMTGGWGNGTQQLAAGLGAGATSAAGTSEAMQKQLEADDKAAETASNQAANRANAVKVAQIGADSRVEGANIRGQARLDAIAATAQHKIPADQLVKYRAEARKIVEGNPQNMAMTNADRETMINDIAMRTYDADQIRRGQGAAPSQNGSPKPTETPGAAVPGQSPAPASTGKPTAQNPTPTRPEDEPGVKAALQNPQMRQLLATPDGQAELRKRYGGKAETMIRAWNLHQLENGYTHKPMGQ